MQEDALSVVCIDATTIRGDLDRGGAAVAHTPLAVDHVAPRLQDVRGSWLDEDIATTCKWWTISSLSYCSVEV